MLLLSEYRIVSVDVVPEIPLGDSPTCGQVGGAAAPPVIVYPTPYCPFAEGGVQTVESTTDGVPLTFDEMASAAWFVIDTLAEVAVIVSAPADLEVIVIPVPGTKFKTV